MQKAIVVEKRHGSSAVLAKEADGLAVHRHLQYGWQVTHIRTGMGIIQVPGVDYRTAQGFAKELRALKCWDWGSPRDKSGMPAGLRDRVKPLYRKWIG